MGYSINHLAEFDYYFKNSPLPRTQPEAFKLLQLFKDNLLCLAAQYQSPKASQ